MHRRQLLPICLVVVLVLVLPARAMWAQAAGSPAGASPNPGAESSPPSEAPNSAEGKGTGETSSAAPLARSSEKAPVLPKFFYKHLTGTIGGKYRIVMNLTRIDGRLAGDYYYADSGIPLFFGYGSTISERGTVHLVETNLLEPTGSSEVTGVFDGRFTGPNELSGSWTKAGGTKPLPFSVSAQGLGNGSIDAGHDSRGYYDQSYGSATMDVTYPIMHSGSAEADAALNTNIVSTVVGLYENGVDSPPPTSIPQAMEDFIRTFTGQLGEPSARTTFPPWTYSITCELLFDASDILSARYESFSFEGGAHPNTLFKNVSYDRITGGQIRLDSLLKPGFQQQLNAIGLKEFRREHGIKTGQSLRDAGYFVSDKNFKLNDNFIITQAGLVFQFNQYEIAPYYFGAQQVLIPYSALSGLILPNSPIAARLASGRFGPLGAFER